MKGFNTIVDIKLALEEFKTAVNHHLSRLTFDEPKQAEYEEKLEEVKDALNPAILDSIKQL